MGRGGVFADTGKGTQTVGNVEKSLQLLLTLAQDPGVIMLWVDNCRGNIFFDRMEEMEACSLEELLPTRNCTHFSLHCLLCAVLWFHCTFTLGNSLH